MLGIKRNINRFLIIRKTTLVRIFQSRKTTLLLFTQRTSTSCWRLSKLRTALLDWFNSLRIPNFISLGRNQMGRRHQIQSYFFNLWRLSRLKITPNCLQAFLIILSDFNWRNLIIWKVVLTIITFLHSIFFHAFSLVPRLFSLLVFAQKLIVHLYKI